MPSPGQRIAVVGYGNQGRSWALNLRDSGNDVAVCLQADPSRDAAEADGFDTRELEGANEADVICLLVPDDVIPTLASAAPPQRRRDRGQRIHPRLWAVGSTL